MRTLIRILFLCFAYCFFNSAFCFGQQAPGIEWQNTLGAAGLELYTKVIPTTDGGYMVAGASLSTISCDKQENSIGNFDIWLLKLNSLGYEQWQHTIGGSGNDVLGDIKQTLDGGFIIASGSNSNISGDKTENSKGYEDYWVIKLDTAGNIQWQKTIGGNNDDYFTSIVCTDDGCYILGGFSESGVSADKSEPVSGGNDFWILKIDSIGNILWQNTLGGNNLDQLNSIAITSNGGCIAGGQSNSPVSGDKSESSLGGWDYWIVKLDSTGTIQWENTIGGSNNDVLWSLQQTNDNGYILCGNSNSNISGDKMQPSHGADDFWIIKLNSSGSIQWQNSIGGSSNDDPLAIEQTSDNGYITTGYSTSVISGNKTENNLGNEDIWVVKLDYNGAIQWDNTIGGSDQDRSTLVHQLTNGGYIISGLSKSNISFDKTENACNNSLDYWALKLFSDSATSITDWNQNKFDLKVFPNPAKDEITIAGYTLQSNQPAVVKIYDVMGKEIFSQSITNRKPQIVNLKSFTNGIYLLQLQTGAKISRVKFIKQ